MKVHCNFGYEQLSDEELNKIEQRMYPKKYSTVGFLQPGETLKEVYEADRLYLEQMGITYKQISDVLTCISRKCYRAQYLNRDDFRYTIETISYNGAQICPFKNKKLDNLYHGYDYGSSDITITDKVTNESITFNTLLIHMIDAHHFFESPLSQHRVDPKKVIKMFDIKPDIDYQPNYKYYRSWDYGGSCNITRLTKDKVCMLTKIGLKSYKIDKNIIGVLLPYRFMIFGEKFFTKLLIWEDSFTWENFMNDYLGDDSDNDEDDEDDEENIKNILKKIDNYNHTGEICNLYLYIFNLSDNKGKYKFNIENVELKYDSRDVEATYICNQINYVPLDDEI
jgi:hypothetical protein